MCSDAVWPHFNTRKRGSQAALLHILTFSFSIQYGTMTATESDNKDLIRDLIETVINDHQVDAVEEYLAEDATVTGAGATHDGAAEFRDFVAEVETAFPDFAFTLEDILAEGQKVAYHVTVTATHEGKFEGIPPTGRSVSYPAVMIATVDDGEVTDLVYESDRVGLMKQLGVME